ncbi:hypothetical protein DPMN_150209 [Dreissena polymorpha]|uniref:Uncharacterized protein n=1 Tax=Dreissena polymorpha TaxID=45954 RepID=A0A9D4J350_DREPO|nr:hypothetical protein DPMN_150209 [Dreissena polymorpha]
MTLPTIVNGRSQPTEKMAEIFEDQLRNHWTSLSSLIRRDTMAFLEPPLVAFRRDCNLEDILVHKKHNRMFSRKPNMSGPCGAQWCAIYQYMLTADCFTDASDRKNSVRNNIDCKSFNVVYTVNCQPFAGTCMW